MNIVYFDMDGVLADWVKAFEARVDIPIVEFNKMSKAERRAIKEEHVRADFFRGLEPIERGVEMFHRFRRINNLYVEVLTAVGDVDNLNVTKAKLAWAREHLGPDVNVRTVHKAHDKVAYVGNGNILIDDRDASLVPWRDAGGIAFKFI